MPKTSLPMPSYLRIDVRQGLLRYYELVGKGTHNGSLVRRCLHSAPRDHTPSLMRLPNDLRISCRRSYCRPHDECVLCLACGRLAPEWRPCPPRPVGCTRLLGGELGGCVP